MAKIPLRAYVKEIENLIERGEIEQAVAHAKNVLKSYPKHIDTYRLLGKAFLESQRYSEAADILQRVLSVIPDDFISQIGMSIIREDEGNLDAAIWHMERAYEVQPFNPAVHDELRRLYGRRDGIEPPKIRLTRGALVRMYNRGELYPQAIAEIRAALAEDPQRLDLRVLLARLYYLSGQKNDAAEVCSELISKLPYCYEANRLLAEILPGTNRAEEAKKFQQRIYALDPYEAFMTPAADTVEQVPDQAVMVERFMWDSAMEEGAAQTPEWTRNIGVQWEEAEEEALPDWLNTLKPEDQGRQETAAAAPAAAAIEETPADDHLTEQSSTQDELVPDWMKEAGWTFTNRSADEIMKEQLQMEDQNQPEGEPGSGEVVPGEIPDWLQSIAPPEASQTAPEEEERTGWLEDILPPVSGKNGSQTVGPADLPGFETETPAEEADLPDWLSAMETPSPAAEVDETSPAEQLPGETELPDWIAGIGQEGAEAPTQVPGIPIDWSQPGEPSSQTENTVDSAADSLDWLKDFDQGTAEAGEPATQAASELDGSFFSASSNETAAEPVEGVPDWLRDMQTDEMPDLSDFEAPGEAETVMSEAQLPETQLSEEETQPETAEQLPDWLAGLATSEEAEQGMPAASTEQEVPAADIPQPEQPESKAAVAQSPEETAPEFQDMYAAMAWLESLAAKQGADEATLTTPPEQRSEVMPDWLAKEAEQPVSEGSFPAAETAADRATTEQVEPGAEAIDFEAANFENSETASVELNQTEQVDDLRSWLAGLPMESESPDRTPAEEPSGALIFGEPGLESEEQNRAEQEVVQPEAAELQTELPVEPELPLSENQPAADTLPAAEPSSAMPDFSDMDAAMAWLESLAAKQGADEATLVTPPEQRTETPPDWVLKEMETSAEERLAESGVTPETLPTAEAAPEIAPQAAEEATSALPDWMQLEETPLAETREVEVLAASEEQVEPTQPMHVRQEEEPPAAQQPAAAEAEAATPDFSDMDAAMAWLESLAAKQGADEATLITPPDQRTETMPDWVAKEAEQEKESLQEAPQPAVEDQVPEFEAALPEIEQPEAELSPADLPDWMKEIAERQAGETPYIEETLPVEELPAAEEQPAEVTPVADKLPEVEEVPETEVSTTSIEPTAEIQQAQSAEESQPVAASATDFDSAFAWLESLAEKQGAQEGTLITKPEERQEVPPEWVSAQELPASGETQMAEEELPTSDALPTAEELLPAEPLPVEELPVDDNLLTEPLPTDFIPMEETQPLAPQAEDMPDWLKQAEAEEPAMETTTQPESIDDWLKGLENEPEPLAQEGPMAPMPGDFRSAWEPELEIQQTAAEVHEPAPTPDWPAGEQPILASLEDALNHGNLDHALSGYNRMINEGQHLEETIHDLRDALYRYPVDINLWQTLGDAYARNNQLQEALDAYTKAEELLR